MKSFTLTTLEKVALLLALVTLLFYTASNAQEMKTTMVTEKAAADANKPAFKFEEMEFNFGTVKQGEAVVHEYKFTNTGKEPIIISNVQGSCHCTAPTWPKEPIKKGETASIHVKFDSSGKQGMQDKTVTINSNASSNPLVLHLKGTVEAPAAATNVDVVK